MIRYVPDITFDVLRFIVIYCVLLQHNLLHCAVDLCKNPAPLKLVGISTKLQLDLVIFVSLLSKKMLDSKVKIKPYQA